MDGEQFLEASGQLAQYIVNYLENIRERKVLPNVNPGYLPPLLPPEAPEEEETWDAVFSDIERVIMPGVTHWHSPQFHAYYPTANSYPSILADMLCGAIGCIGFSWMSSPACTELEVVMMDWLGQLIGLPDHFLFKSNKGGGGVIQGTASEATLVVMLAAKIRTLRKLDSSNSATHASELSLVAYASDQSHSSVERAAMLAGVKIKLLPSDDNYSLRGHTLKKALQEDMQQGLIPFCVLATVGTTNCCAFDNLRELGEVANDFNLWLHVDAAFAGSAFVCEEFRYPMDGIELVDSFNFNPHKWLLVNFDCSALWLRKSHEVVDAFNVDPLYLKHQHQGKMPDYRHWQIPLGRRFRSLKLWFVMRLYGKKGLQRHIRKQVALAKEFDAYVAKDDRFEIFFPTTLGLVCFRLKGENEQNEVLLKSINDGGAIHLVPAKIRATYVLRFAVCSRFTESSDILKAWKEIQEKTTLLLNQSSGSE